MSRAAAKNVPRRHAGTQRKKRRLHRLILLILVPVVAAAILAAIVVTAPSAYSGFDILGQQPAIVQVFLPG